MGNAKTKEAAWFVKPNPCLLRREEFSLYLVGGEQTVPDDQTLQQRAYEMIINEPANVKHRLMYAIMAIRQKGEKNIVSGQAELLKYIDDAKACDPNESKVYSLLGFLYEKTGQQEKAKEVGGCLVCC